MQPASYDWNMVTAIATSVYALAVVVSLPLLWLQIRRMRSAQEATIAIALQDRSTDPAMHGASLWLKTQMPENFPYEDYKKDPQAREKLERLWYHLEFVGVLVAQGYVNERLIFEQQGAFIAGVWDRCQPLIYARRIDRKSPQYMENFELLRKRFDTWGRKNRPRVWAMEKRQTAGYYSLDASRPSPQPALGAAVASPLQVPGTTQDPAKIRTRTHHK